MIYWRHGGDDLWTGVAEKSIVARLYFRLPTFTHLYKSSVNFPACVASKMSLNCCGTVMEKSMQKNWITICFKSLIGYILSDH